MKINSYNTNLSTGMSNSRNVRIQKPSFTSYYEIDGNSAISREQVFTLGTLMNNFWLQDTRNTFYEVKRKNVSGKFTVHVNDLKDRAFEDIMQRNNIKITITDRKIYY